jgi:hypothetical protein
MESARGTMLICREGMFFWCSVATPTRNFLNIIISSSANQRAWWSGNLLPFMVILSTLLGDAKPCR